MKKYLKIPVISLFFLLVVLIGYLNLSLYYHPEFKKLSDGYYNVDVYNQLNFLKSELENDADIEMQGIFPEGFVFINSLYGLSWCNLIENIDSKSQVYTEGIKEIEFALEKINSEKAKHPFTKDLHLKYGAFYRGWSNYLLGKKISVQPVEKRDSADIILFKRNCDEISDALNESSTPFLESYGQSSWPADATVAVSSLAMYDRIFEQKYANVIAAWVEKVKILLDENTGLIPHSTYFDTGKTIEGARGSSQSLILNFLIDIDRDFAEKQFKVYKNLFVDTRFGLEGIREYLKEKKGDGDIDSGPVILGIGAAASIVGQRTMGKYGDWSRFEELRNCIETFGVAYTKKSKKRYIFGKLPIADAFIAWSNSLEKMESDKTVIVNWRRKFQILSIISILLLGALISAMTKNPIQRSQTSRL